LKWKWATVIHVGVDRKAAGLIAIADPIKGSTPDAIAALRGAGMRVVMLTGDNRETAEAVARKLGIADVEPDALPNQKGRGAAVARGRSVS
jgi:Cu+-exporting ATPase